MANNPFDRTIINVRERPLSSDVNQAQSQLDYAHRYFAQQLFAARQSPTVIDSLIKSGFVGDAFQVREQSPTGLFVDVRAGLGFLSNPADVLSTIDTVGGLDDLSGYKPVVLLADQTFAVPAAPAGPNTRIDIIEVRYERATGNPLNRDVLNTGTGQFQSQLVNKTLEWVLDGKVGQVTDPASSTEPLSYKVGTAGNPGVVPPTTAGYTKIAEVHVGSGVTVIEDGDILDPRPLLFPSGVGNFRFAFNFSYNGGSPIVTPLKAMGIAGADYGIVSDVGLGAVNQMLVYVKAGGSTDAIPMVSPAVYAFGNDGGNELVQLSVRGDNGAGGGPPYWKLATSADVSNAAAGEKPLALQVGQPIAQFDLHSRLAANGGAVGDGDSNLEVIDWLVDVAFTY